MTRASSLVLGLGNRLATADAFGPAVIDRLHADGGLPGCALVDAHTDLLHHLDEFAGRDRVVLADAVLAHGTGCVTVFEEEEFSTWDDRSTGAHALSAVAAVKLFRRLGPRDSSRPRITLVAYLVDEEAFRRAPAPEAIETGARAVRCLLAGVSQ